jgi:hypothetical protein
LRTIFLPSSVLTAWFAIALKSLHITSSAIFFLIPPA